MPRIDLPSPDRMTPEQRRVHDQIVSGRRGRIQGPLRAALRTFEPVITTCTPAALWAQKPKRPGQGETPSKVGRGLALRRSWRSLRAAVALHSTGGKMELLKLRLSERLKAVADALKTSVAPKAVTADLMPA